jgi:heat shock protein HslJ
VRVVASVILATALIVGACSGTGGGAPSPSPTTLDGRTFLSTTVRGHDLVAGSTLRLWFQGDRLGISAGCNQMSGTYSIADGRLVIGQMATTEMACEPALMDQDTWVGAFLDGATVTLTGDTLTLGHGDVTLTLVDREVADPDRPLERTRWIVDGIVTGDAVSSVPVGVTAAMTFSNGQLQVEAGCNAGSASVSATDTTLTIGPLALTRKACAPETMAVERAVTAVLSGQVDYTIEADVLTLTVGGASHDGLMLRATP